MRKCNKGARFHKKGNNSKTHSAYTPRDWTYRKIENKGERLERDETTYLDRREREREREWYRSIVGWKGDGGTER